MRWFQSQQFSELCFAHRYNKRLQKFFFIFFIKTRFLTFVIFSNVDHVLCFYNCLIMLLKLMDDLSISTEKPPKEKQKTEL